LSKIKRSSWNSGIAIVRSFFPTSLFVESTGKRKLVKEGKGIFFSYFSYFFLRSFDPKFGMERLRNIGWVKNCEFLLILNPAFVYLSYINLANFFPLLLNLSSHDRRRKALKKSDRIRNTIALLELHLTPTSLLFTS
jgi:hypothetical protein